MGRKKLIRRDGTVFHFQGELGRRLSVVTDQWLLPVAAANPRLLEMFRERDFAIRNQVPWAGEFAGKHLTAATQILRLTGDRRLRENLEWFVGELISLQAEDGYLGPWPKAFRMTADRLADAEGCRTPWDAWGHYHIMTGLQLWYGLTGDAAALRCSRRIADFMVRRFLHGAERMHDLGEREQEMNMAPVHSLAVLYQLTGENDYLELAQKIVGEFADPPAGDYFRLGLADVPYWKTPKPRWEALHSIMGFAAVYEATGDEALFQAFRNLWWSMLEGDRHNNGGFSSQEKALGNPYHPGAIETCCTVAWNAMSVEMLHLTGDSRVADELELSLLNSGYGLLSPSGRWVTYNTPMDGVREASAHRIVFQARAGASELNCCSVNGPRMLGLVGEWALLAGTDGAVVLNYYGAGVLCAPLASGRALTLTQRTDYPLADRVEIEITLEKPEEFVLALRIPGWSERNQLRINGESGDWAVSPGKYCRIRRRWQSGDRVELQLDFRTRLWLLPADRKAPELPADRTFASLYRGPLLLAWDRALNGSSDDFPDVLNVDTLRVVHPPASRKWLAPLLTMRVRTENGGEACLCDFASAGVSGSSYRSWLPVDCRNTAPVEFSRDNPFRSCFAEA